MSRNKAKPIRRQGSPWQNGRYPTMLCRGPERSRTLQVLLSVIWKLSGDKALPFWFHGQIHHTRQSGNHLLHNIFFRTNRQTKRFPFPMSFHWFHNNISEKWQVSYEYWQKLQNKWDTMIVQPKNYIISAIKQRKIRKNRLKMLSHFRNDYCLTT